jgi:predicted nucleic acid-binding protein
VNHQHLFTQLAAEVIVPTLVAEEVNAGAPNDPARQYMALGLLRLVESPPAPPSLLAWDLGMGESAVLAYALANYESTAVLDDGAARRYARSYGIPIKGTLGIVLLAKQRGLIPSAASLLMVIRDNGFWLKDSVIAEALHKTVGESWPGCE